MRNICRYAFIAACAALTGCGGSSIAGLGTFIDIGPASDAFNPQTLRAAVGEPITWTNKSANTHSVTFDVNVGGPDSDVQFPAGMVTGDIYTWTVPLVASGTKYYYHCRFHGTAGNGSSFGTGMVGVIIVK